MGFGKRLALVTSLLALMFGITSNSRAGIFKSIYDPSKDSVTFEGRMCFHDLGNKYSKWMENGRDEVGLFVGDTCIGSTSQVSSQWSSHYDGLNINRDYLEGMVSGGLNYSVKAWNAETNSVWNARVMGTRFSQNGIDVSAYENTYAIPDPSTITLFGVGALALKGRKKN
jgi:hypothetical protein